MANNLGDIFPGHAPLLKNTSQTHIGVHLTAVFVRHGPATLALVEQNKGRHLTLSGLIKISSLGI